MKLYVFVIFIVTQTVLSEKAVSKLRRKLIIPKINDDCRKIKCSSVEEPACARLRRHDLKTTFHIIVVNKCELDYIKCHDDVEAKLVPMKFCGHAEESKASKKQNKSGAAHRRVKRYVRKTTSTKDKNHTGAIQDNKKPEVKAGQQWKNEAYNSILSDHEAPVNDVKINRIDRNLKRRGNRYTSDSNSDTEQNERKKLGKGISGHPIDIVEPHALQSIDEPNFKIPLQNMKMEMKSVNINDRGNEDFDIMQSGESVNNTNAALLEIDKEEYKEMCPSVCPSRDVMVCAKCQHGIYKTFVSVCHMRMFSCYHSDEVLELISRYPCVLSAPYISEPEMKPVGRISEPADEDPVLKYIMCRDRGMLGGPQVGPRCVVRRQKKRPGLPSRRPSKPKSSGTDNRHSSQIHSELFSLNISPAPRSDFSGSRDSTFDHWNSGYWTSDGDWVSGYYSSDHYDYYLPNSFSSSNPSSSHSSSDYRYPNSFSSGHPFWSPMSSDYRYSSSFSSSNPSSSHSSSDYRYPNSFSSGHPFWSPVSSDYRYSSSLSSGNPSSGSYWRPSSDYYSWYYSS